MKKIISYKGEEILQEVSDYTVREAINFFNKPKTRKIPEDERFFYNRKQYEMVIQAVNPKLIKTEIIKDKCDSVFCYVIRPVYI